MTSSEDAPSPLDPLVTGEPVLSWCNMCLTTSHYRMEIHLMTPGGLVPLGWTAGCVRCLPLPGSPETETESA